MGDFNFHVNEPSRDRLAAKFLDFLDSYNLAQHVTEPTHKRKGTLDLIITRANEDTVLNCKVEDPDLSDHYAVHCMLTLDKPTFRRVEKTYIVSKTAKCRYGGFTERSDNFTCFHLPGYKCNRFISTVSK